MTATNDDLSVAAYCGAPTAFEALGPARRDALRTHEWRVFDRPEEYAVEDMFLPFAAESREAQLIAARAAASEAYHEKRKGGHDVDEILEVFLALPDLCSPLDPVAETLARGVVDLGPLVRHGSGARRSVVALARTVLDLKRFDDTLFTAAEVLGLHRTFEVARHDLLASDAALSPRGAAYLGDPEARRAERPALGGMRWLRGLARFGHGPLLVALATLREVVTSPPEGRRLSPGCTGDDLAALHDDFVRDAHDRALPDHRRAVSMFIEALATFEGADGETYLLRAMKEAVLLESGSRARA